MFSQNQDQSQKAALDPSQVPTAVTGAFTDQNPGITATWRADGQNFRASYIDPSSKLGRIIIYDKEGNVLRREDEVDNVTFPAPINDYYNKHHPGEIYQVWKSDEKANGHSMYYSSRNDETIWFDSEGHVIPAKKAERTKKKK